MDAAAEESHQLSAWYYVRVAEGEFRRIGQQPFSDFFGRRIAFPAPVQGQALTAELVVARRGRQILRLWSTDFRRYALTPDGFFDERARWSFVTAYEDLAGVLDVYRGKLPRRLPARARLIRRRIDTLYGWDPSEADWDALERLVNRRAGFPLVGNWELHLCH
jgi:hypothetical protein